MEINALIVVTLMFVAWIIVVSLLLGMFGKDKYDICYGDMEESGHCNTGLCPGKSTLLSDQCGNCRYYIGYFPKGDDIK